MMLVDSHCHLDRLDLKAHGGSLDAALAAARARGVGRFLCIGISAANAAAVRQLAHQYPDVYCSVGVHPLDVEPGKEPPLAWLLNELNDERVVAIGETELLTLEKLLEQGRRNGVPGMHIISADEMRSREPEINPLVSGAL